MIRIFRHYIPQWSLLLLVVEGLLCIVSVYAGVHMRFLDKPMPDPIHAEVLMPRALLFAAVMVVSLTAVGRYQQFMENGLIGEVLSLALSFLIGFVAISLLFYVFPNLFLGRGAFGFSMLFAFVSMVLLRWFFYHFLLDRSVLQRRIIVFGTGEKAALIQRHEATIGSKGFILLGYWPDSQIPVVDSQYILHSQLSLADYARQQSVDEIVIAQDAQVQDVPLPDLMECKRHGMIIADIPSFFEKEFRQIDLEAVWPQWWILHAEGATKGTLRDAIKKAFDFLVSLLILSIVWPIMILTGLAIWIESRGHGPIFYRQLRVGYGGKNFALMKFRSMCPEAELDGIPRWSHDEDPRITRIGHIIRKTRIDELPQLFNVLSGEMSIVGPRPERPEFVSMLQNSIPYYLERLRVKPGITGWAQISYGYGATCEDAAEKLKYDLYYVKNHSLFLDLLVLIQSVEVVLFGKSAQGPRVRKRPT